MRIHKVIDARPALSMEELQALRLSKGEAFDNLDGAFDYALPQGWLNDFADWCANNKDRARGVNYESIRSTTVWHVEHGPVTCCKEVRYAFRRYDAACRLEVRS